jgi:hypothetical protein
MTFASGPRDVEQTFVFNPFASLPADVALATLRYDFTFDEEQHVFIDVPPVRTKRKPR